MDIPGNQVRAAYRSAPVPVREVFDSEATVRTVLAIKAKYGLHVDTASKVGEHIGYMLLGLMSPVEFLGSLVALNIDQATAKGIVEDVNREIFLPLREKMKSGGIAPERTHSADAEHADTWVQVLPGQVTPQPEPVPSATQQSQPDVPPSPPPPPNLPTAQPMESSPAPQTQATQPPRGEATVSVATEAEPLAHPHARTMAEDMELAKAGIYVHREESPAQPAPQPSERPAVSAFPQPKPETPPRPSPNMRHTPTPPQGRPIVKSYAVDPYREPIE